MVALVWKQLDIAFIVIRCPVAILASFGGVSSIVPRSARARPQKLNVYQSIMELPTRHLHATRYRPFFHGGL
jgi:hypothetical protein